MRWCGLVWIRQRERGSEFEFEFEWRLCNSHSVTQPRCGGDHHLHRLFYYLPQNVSILEAEASWWRLLLLLKCRGERGDSSSRRPQRYRCWSLLSWRNPKSLFLSGKECTSLSTLALCFSTLPLSLTTPTMVVFYIINLLILDTLTLRLVLIWMQKFNF